MGDILGYRSLSTKKTTLWVIIFASFLPMFLAYALYFTPARAWLKTKPKGILLEKPLRVDDGPLQKWQMWYVVGESCDNRCQKSVTQLKNARIALGKDSDRVLLKTISPREDLPFLQPGTVAIVDPDHWLMIYYLPDMPYQGLLADLRKMLKYSHIG